MQPIKQKLLSLLTAMTLVLCAGTQCSLFSDEEDDDTMLYAAAAYLYLNSSSALTYCSSSASTGSTIDNKTATTTGGSSGCIAGVTTSMDSSLPSWIKDNFTCSLGYLSSNSEYYCFKSKNLPNHRSYYWAGKTEVDAGNSGDYDFYTSLPTFDATAHTAAGTNQITSQDFLYAIPVTATADTDGSLTSTQGGLASIGITRNGVAIYNNAANAPDTLSDEEKTFDGFGSHPQNTGITHHHAYVVQYSTDKSTTTTAQFNNDANLIGITLDGYAIYGLKCDKGTAATGDDFSPTLDDYHGHTAVTVHFTTATYHYHYAMDATAGIKTLMGSYFYGNVGAVSN